MSGKWSPEQHAKYATTIGVRRAERPDPPKTRRQRGSCAEPFARCGTLLPTGNPCRMPADHPDSIAHRERLKGAYALAVVKAMTGVDLATRHDGQDEPARTRATVESVEALPETDEHARDDGASVADQFAALNEAVDQMRWTMLRVDDRLALLVKAAGIVPVPPYDPTKDPDLVAAFRTLHLRLLRLERANVTSGDWEEDLDEVLQTVRQMDRKMGRMIPPAPRKSRAK